MKTTAFVSFLCIPLFLLTCSSCVSQEKQDVLMEATGAVLTEYQAVSTELSGLLDTLIQKNPENKELKAMKTDLLLSMSHVSTLGVEIKSLLSSTSLTQTQQDQILGVVSKLVSLTEKSE